MDKTMQHDDMERWALKRDKAFLWKLVLALAAGIIFGGMIAGRLADPQLGGCAARGFGSLSGEPAPAKAPAKATIKN